MSLKKRRNIRNKTIKIYKIDNKFKKLNLLNKNYSIMPSIKQKLIPFLEQIIKIKNAKGEHYKAKLIDKALSIIATLKFNSMSSLEGIKGIGPMTIRKCQDFLKRPNRKLKILGSKNYAPI